MFNQARQIGMSEFSTMLDHKVLTNSYSQVTVQCMEIAGILNADVLAVHPGVSMLWSHVCGMYLQLSTIVKNLSAHLNVCKMEL